MKILHFIPTYAPAWSWGGPVVSTSSLCEQLVQIGHEVRVLATDAGLESALPKETIRNGVSVRYCRRIEGRGIKSPELEERVMQEIAGFDIVHITGVWQRTSPAACRAALAAGVPYVVSPRGALGPYSWTQKRLKKLIYFALRERANLNGATGFHFTSLMEAKECRRYSMTKLSCVIPNGVVETQPRLTAPAIDEWRLKHGIDGGIPLLLFVGRIHHKKGLDLLPAVLAELKDLNWQMVFVGNDEDGSLVRLKNSFTAHRLSERIRFLPQMAKNELSVVYSAASLFLLPSRHENFGNVVVEALSCGCPCILSDQVGLAEDTKDVGGVLIVPRVPDQWIAAIRGALNGDWKPVARDRLAGWTSSRFDAQKMAGQMAGFYDEVRSHAKQ